MLKMAIELNPHVEVSRNNFLEEMDACRVLAHTKKIGEEERKKYDDEYRDMRKELVIFDSLVYEGKYKLQGAKGDVNTKGTYLCLNTGVAYTRRKDVIKQFGYKDRDFDNALVQPDGHTPDGYYWRKIKTITCRIYGNVGR